MKYVIMLVMLFFIGALVGANFYLSRRIIWFFNVENRKLVYIAFALITVFMFFGIASLTNAKGILANIMYATSAISLGFTLYLLISLNLVDIFRIFVKTQPIVYGIIAFSLAILVSTYGIFNAFNVRTKKLVIPITELKQEINVMHWTDIHLGHFRGGKFLQKLVDKTKQENVDLLFITGDLFDGRINLKKENLEPLKQLNIPIYFVEGNHDGYTGKAEIKAMLRAIGVSVLENEVVNWGELQIIGLNHILADGNSVNMHASGQHATIQNVLPKLNIQKDAPTVLLHHSPDGLKYVSEYGVNLYLAGHTHAGQLIPINYINELIFKYNKGLHEYNGTQIYVSSGAGTFGPPMRIGTRSEITCIKLNPKDNHLTKIVNQNQ